MIKVLKPNDHISANDRIASYGDGCFTTMRVESSVPQLLKSHIERLRWAAQRLSIQYQGWIELSNTIVEHAKSMSSGVIKVVISRGQGGRGYGTEGIIEANCYLSCHDIPVHYDAWRAQGIRLGVSEIKLAQQPLLAGIKHLNRLEQVLVKHQLQQMDVDDVVVLDSQSNIVECSASNLFWRSGNAWYTPNLSQCGVEGVMRNHIITLMHENNIEVNQVITDISAMEGCDEVFICNSVMKCVPVTEFSSNKFTCQWDYRSSTVEQMCQTLGIE